MCGIVGYVGNREAVGILMEGLARLEYRGYDSAGVALMREDTIEVRKAKGRLDHLRAALKEQPVTGSLGIGHTRWATHGEPSQVNSHPHTDEGGAIAVVHNGIIENYARLKAWLIERGCVFQSETDTEVVAHLLHQLYQERPGDMEGAIVRAMHRIEGSYALAVLCSDAPDALYCVRKDNPLVIGRGEGESFIASDIPAMLPFTREIYALEDGEIATLRAGGVRVLDALGRQKKPEFLRIDWDVAAAEKGGYPHYMLKEMHEQPKALRDTLHAYADTAERRVRQELMALDRSAARSLRRVLIVACGTAYHAGMVGKHLLESIAGVAAEADIASEFRYRDARLDSGSLCVAISQSGETADTLAAMRKAKKAGLRVVAITNVVGSTLAREADHVLYTRAGPEIAVASTKAYTTQLMLLTLLAVDLAEKRGQISPAERQNMLCAMAEIPDQAAEALGKHTDIQRFANRHVDQKNVYFMGRGLDCALAMEGSLKLKEISYTFSEAYAAGELKHGTIALIEPGTVVAALCTQPHLLEKMRSNIQEVRARGAEVLCVAMPGMQVEQEERWEIPETLPQLTPMLAVLPLQMFAYYMAVEKGCDVDKPRNLAKSVTVE